MNEINEFYQKEIVENFWPFWENAFDRKYGGVFTCYTNDGSQLVSRDKYTWSQGRFLWLCSELYQLAEAGRLPLEPASLKDMAEKTYAFLKKHTLTRENHVLYAVTEDGGEIEGQKDISIYADCFFVLGVNKYAEIFNYADAFSLAVSVYKTVNTRVLEGKVKTEPYPIPEGYLSHSINMILLNVAQEIEKTADQFSFSIESLGVKTSGELSRYILREFIAEDGRCIELKPEREGSGGTLLENHLNPGHTLESIWFHLHSMHEWKESERGAVLEALSKVALKAIEAGWDEEYGGLLRFVDKNGGKPSGRENDDEPYCALIRDTWDTKLWWPHSEALYTLLLLYQHTKKEVFKEWYQRVAGYTFKTFPNPDKQIGEWIQIRDRQGKPLNKVVALPVKDPFHVIRNFILIMKLF
ncbi:AGE family epimerase/isomerase [Bacillus infantis]|uniref:AGE family epimerase/isomerase n=1 Tax=Bacillus infantis TaxID=324767 RepID=UPI003CF42FE3